jgi:uncharacterized protein (TIGR03067 family)
MRRTVLMLAGVLLSVVALGSDSPKEYDNATTLGPLEGTWQLTEIQCNGHKINLDFQMVVTYRGGTYMLNDGETFRGRYRVDPNRNLAYLDRIPSCGYSRGQTFKFIYQIEGDTLRIAYTHAPEDTPRPQGFNDAGVFVDTYKRVKK